MDRDQGRLWACVAGSLAAHILALAFVTLGSSGQAGMADGSQGGQADREGAGSKQGRFKNVAEPIQARLESLPPDESGRQPPDPALLRGDGSAPGACDPGDQSYEGIGISYSNFTGEVRRAPADYPAYQAGIREGDVVENVGAQPQGGYLSLALLRGGRRSWLRVKTMTICYSPGLDEIPERTPSGKRGPFTEEPGAR